MLFDSANCIERTPQVPGYTDRRALTILRKQIRLSTFTLSRYQAGVGVGICERAGAPACGVRGGGDIRPIDRMAGEL